VLWVEGKEGGGEGEEGDAVVNRVGEGDEEEERVEEEGELQSQRQEGDRAV